MYMSLFHMHWFQHKFKQQYVPYDTLSNFNLLKLMILDIYQLYNFLHLQQFINLLDADCD